MSVFESVYICLHALSLDIALLHQLVAAERAAGG